MNAIQFLNELITRFKTEKPDFFKKLQAIALIIGALSGGVIAYDYLITDLPDKLDKLATTVFTVASTLYLTGQLPNKDK